MFFVASYSKVEKLHFCSTGAQEMLRTTLKSNTHRKVQKRSIFEVK